MNIFDVQKSLLIMLSRLDNQDFDHFVYGYSPGISKSAGQNSTGFIS